MTQIYHLTYVTLGFLGSHWFTDLPSAATMANALSCQPDVSHIAIASVIDAADLVFPMVTGVKRA